MAFSEKLAIIINANGAQAMTEFGKVGAAAERNLGKAESRSAAMAAGFTSAGTKMLGAGVVLSAGLWKAGEATSDLAETVSQSEQVFGSAASKIGEFAKSANSIGQSERQAREGANTFGLFFKNAGKSADESARMSIEMAKLASDMASFKNTSPEEAITAIGAALRGESEPIRQYGVMLDDATLKQRALSMGLIDTATGTLPPAIRMQAAYAEVLAQTGTIQGDFARTSDGFANSQRKMAAEIENTKAKIGEGFVPVMQAATSGLSGLASGIGKLDDKTNGAASTFLATAATIATVGGGSLIAAGQIAKIAKQAREASEGMAGMKGSGAAAAIAITGITTAYSIWTAEIEKYKAASKSVAEQAKDRIMMQDWDHGGKVLQEVRNQIAGLDNDIAAINPNSFWDADHRKELSDFRNELAGVVNETSGYRQQVEDLAKSKGISIEMARKEIDATNTSKDATKDAAAATKENAKETKSLADAWSDAKSAMSAYFDKTTSVLDADLAMREASVELHEALKKNGAQFDWNTGSALRNSEAARENIRAAEDFARAAGDKALAVAEETGSVEKGTAVMQAQRDELIKSLMAMNWSREGAEKYATQLGLVPSRIATVVQVAGVEDAVTRLDQLDTLMARLSSRTASPELLKAVNAAASTMFSGAGGRTVPGGWGGARAHGGPVSAGVPYTVGDAARPEVFVPETNGTILPSVPSAGAVHVYIDSREVASALVRSEGRY